MGRIEEIIETILSIGFVILYLFIIYKITSPDIHEFSCWENNGVKSIKHQDVYKPGLSPHGWHQYSMVKCTIICNNEDVKEIEHY